MANRPWHKKAEAKQMAAFLFLLKKRNEQWLHIYWHYFTKKEKQ